MIHHFIFFIVYSIYVQNDSCISLKRNIEKNNIFWNLQGILVCILIGRNALKYVWVSQEVLPIYTRSPALELYIETSKPATSYLTQILTQKSQTLGSLSFMMIKWLTLAQELLEQCKDLPMSLFFKFSLCDLILDLRQWCTKDTYLILSQVVISHQSMPWEAIWLKKPTCFHSVSLPWKLFPDGQIQIRASRRRRFIFLTG